ncbi:hypothetical protein KSP40_PGU000396 [Platanthera guangdongensis]|uniref:Uncharacterized protein n=1 Tax=Platanthera guangdongensis TaxID=2320717 RepID=A0ABR2LN97_9ASPA
MFPKDWTPPCQSCCTKKYAYIAQIPCVEACNEICYKDPVLKDHQWSAYIDRSPGIDTYSLSRTNFSFSCAKIHKLSKLPFSALKNPTLKLLASIISGVINYNLDFH